MTIFDRETPVSPDGLRYLELPDVDQPRPYHYRWLIPAIARGDRSKFSLITAGSLAALFPLSRAYTGSWVPALLLPGLPGVIGFNAQWPVLVDAPAMALALAAAVCVQHRWWTTAMVCSLAAGATKETAPIFAALYASNPFPLVGLVSPAWRHRHAVPLGLEPEWEPFDQWVLRHPIQAAQLVRRDMDRKRWWAPWGALLAGFANPTPQVVATTALAYAQCAVATDTVRLYQWAWPVLAKNAARSLGGWWPLALAAHYANPHKGDGA